MRLSANLFLPGFVLDLTDSLESSEIFALRQAQESCTIKEIF